MIVETMGLVAGGLLLAAVVALAWPGLRRERYRVSQDCRFACPRTGSDAACELVQDVRTGQWRELRGCSLQQEDGAVPCDEDCVRRLNLGLHLDGWRQRSGASWLSSNA